MSLSLFKLLSGGGYGVINLNINTVEVVEGRRTIRAQWNPEMAQDLVPVQPLPGPRGVLHYLDFNYGEHNFKNFKLLRG